MNLDVLARSADLSVGERRMMADVTHKHERPFEGLQRLARGDAAEAVPRELLDLTEVVDAAVANASAPSGRDGHVAGPDELMLEG